MARLFEVVATMRDDTYEIEANIDRENERELLFYIDEMSESFVGVMKIPSDEAIAFCEQVLARLKGGD